MPPAYILMPATRPVPVDENLLRVMIQYGKSDNGQAPGTENGRLVGMIWRKNISLHNELKLYPVNLWQNAGIYI